MTKDEALKMAMGVLLSINQGKQHLIVIDDDRGFFQREEWVRWAIDEVVPQIKEALEQPLTRDWKETIDERIAKDDAFKQALEQPAQEPVAWMYKVKKIKDNFSTVSITGCCNSYLHAKNIAMDDKYIFPLYTHLAPSWQGLSDDEISHLKYLHVDYELFDEGEYGTECNVYVDDFARAIEQALKEKNT